MLFQLISVVLRGIQPYMDEINRCRRMIMIGAGTSFHIAVAVSILKPSAHSTIFVAEDEDFCRWRRKLAVCGKHIQNMIFVAGNRDLVFCRQRRKRIFSMYDIEDRRQRQKPFICVSRTQQVFVASDKNRRPQRKQSSCVG